MGSPFTTTVLCASVPIVQLLSRSSVNSSVGPAGAAANNGVPPGLDGPGRCKPEIVTGEDIAPIVEVFEAVHPISLRNHGRVWVPKKKDDEQ